MTLMPSRHIALALPLALSACPDTGGTTTDQGPTTAATTSGSTDPTADDANSDGPATTSTATLDPTTGSATTTTDSTTGDESSGQLDSTRGPDITTETTTASTTEVSTASDTEFPTLCGNGVLDDGESCDDGNADDLDLCRNDCTPGPSGQGLGFPLPPLLAGESLSCFTAIDGAFSPNRTPALVLGSYGWVENTDDFLTRARQFALPGIGQPQWTWSLESDAVEWLPVFEAATAANGDVVLAGPAWNQEVLSDGLGAFWLARLTAAGDLVWQSKYDDLHLQPFDLAIAPDGDIVVAGMITNIVSSSEVHRFTGDGALLWSAAQDPFDEFPTLTSYHSLAVDADAVYVVGQRRDLTDDLPIHYRVHLRALSSDGAPCGRSIARRPLLSACPSAAWRSRAASSSSR
ncbi:hypothetical protein [Nannocystis pusilla]|uniref:hypothetical protein n=1 Tax=Nannocystis pusilla TaxID=889268 RepID=UPI003B7F582F